MSTSEWVLTAPAPHPAATVTYGDHPSHFGQLRLPPGAGPHPLVLALHGGFWRSQYNLEHLGHLCAALTDSGFATWSVEYRRLGHQGGGYPGTLEDVAQAVATVPRLAREHAVDVTRLALIGHSAGGHLALWAAGLRRNAPVGGVSQALSGLRGVVALAPVSNLVEAWRLRLGNGVVEQLMGAAPDQAPDAYRDASPIERLPLGVPQIVVHGDEDDTVPISLSRAYVKRAAAAGDAADLDELTGAGHYEPIDPKSYAFPRLCAHLTRLLTQR